VIGNKAILPTRLSEAIANGVTFVADRSVKKKLQIGQRMCSILRGTGSYLNQKAPQ